MLSDRVFILLSGNRDIALQNHSDMNNLISQYLTWHDIYKKSSMENNSLQNLTLDKNIFLPNIKSTTKLPTSSDDTPTLHRLMKEMQLAPINILSQRLCDSATRIPFILQEIKF